MSNVENGHQSIAKFPFLILEAVEERCLMRLQIREQLFLNSPNMKCDLVVLVDKIDGPPHRKSGSILETSPNNDDFIKVLNIHTPAGQLT